MFGRTSNAKKGSGAASKPSADVGAAFNEKKKLQVDTAGPVGALAGQASVGARALGKSTRIKSPKSAAIPPSGKQKLPTVTMDDLFGATRAGKTFGAPIIDMANAFEAEDLPDIFKQASDYSDFSFGNSPLDVDTNTRDRSVSPIVSPQALMSSPNASVRGTGKKMAPAIAAVAANKKKGGILRSTFSGPFVASKSSFEAVFEHPKDMRGGEDFEMESPFMLEAAGEIKDAAVRVLSQQSESIEDKARKLFFLEQLNKPAPPVVPPKLSPAAISNNNNVRKSYVKKKRGVRNYDPAQTALGIANGSAGFGIFLDVVTNKDLDVGWRLRVELLRDLAHQLMRIHESGKAHNSLDDPSSTLLAIDTFRGAIADEKGTLQPKKEDIDGIGRVKRDILNFGIICLQVCIQQRASSASNLDKFLELIRIEGKCKDFSQVDDQLTSLNEDADRQVREALAHAQTPGSLLELCAQCCGADRMLRPQSEDAWDWLDSIVGDMDKAVGASGAVNSNDLPDQMSAKLKSMQLVKKPLLSPKLADVSSGASEYDSDATSVTGSDAMSIASNDSFQPPSDQDQMKEKRKSKLTDFISTNVQQDEFMGTSGSRARPQSLNLSGNGAKLAMFLSADSETTDSTTKAGTEAWQQERTRRRSLDRGYMWAKQKFATDDDADAKSKRMTRRIVAQDNVQKFEQAWKVAAASTKTRKAEEIAQLFSNQERIPQEEALGIIKRAEQVMKKEKNLLEIKPPVIIVGDIHGQFFDLLNMLKIAGEPGKTKTKQSYLFLGDYVDRGDFSCEVLLYLLALKGEFPDSVFLLRGNHECRNVSSYFGFKEECEVKYGLTVFNRCVTAFQVMPIAGLVETQAGRFLCCHGGISPNILSLDQFKDYNRFVEPGMNGFLCDLLWSDPVKDAHEDGSDMSLGDFLSIDYLPNPARGCSYRYGFKALVSFLAINKLVALVRAHEVQMSGYRYHFQELTGGKSKTAAQVMPPVVTVFSAPNYTNKYGNLGAFLKVHANPPFKPVKDKTKGKGVGFKPLELLEPVQFKEVPHPPPMQHRNEQVEQVMQITGTCPYMPTTFHAFIKRALDLAAANNDEALLERERVRASRAVAPVQMHSKQHGNTANKQDAEDAELDKLVEKAEQTASRPKSLGAKMLASVGVKTQSAENNAEVTQVKADVASKKNWKALQQLGLDKPPEVPSGTKHLTFEERLATEKFESAAENDGMNEMNPMLLAEKVELAKQKILEKNLVDDVTVFQPSSEEVGGGSKKKHESMDNRRSMGLKKASAHRLKVGDKSRPESMKDLKSLTEKTVEEGPTPVEEGAMSFSSKELLALQMLFLLIDRNDKGLIDEDDLIAWSAEEGYAVQRQEAEICLRAVDADEDGKIGFEDYLAFAARSKDQWLVGEYSNVLNAVHDIKMQRLESLIG